MVSASMFTSSRSKALIATQLVMRAIPHKVYAGVYVWKLVQRVGL